MSTLERSLLWGIYAATILGVIVILAKLWANRAVNAQFCELLAVLIMTEEPLTLEEIIRRGNGHISKGVAPVLLRALERHKAISTTELYQGTGYVLTPIGRAAAFKLANL